MAASVGDTPGDVFRRTKSGTWMLGQARLAGFDLDQARSVLAELQRTERRDFEPPAGLPLTGRRPIAWLEPMHAPCWAERAEQLRELVNGEPIDALTLLGRGAALFGGSDKAARNRAIQAAAAAEALGLLHFVAGRWQRDPPEPSVPPSASSAGGVRTATSTLRFPGVAEVATAVRIGGAPPRQQPKPPHPPTNHPWRTKPPMSQAAAPSTNHEPRNGKPNGASASAPAASVSESATPSSGVAVGKPAPSAKELERRAKVSKALKDVNAKKRAAVAEPTGELDQVLEQALEPVLRRAIGRVIGKLLKEAIGS
jgi:hypothetical protein